MRAEPIYMERYCLLVRAEHELAGATSVSWAEAAKQPLRLLGRVAVDRDPVSPLVLAAFECAKSVEPPRHAEDWEKSAPA